LHPHHRTPIVIRGIPRMVIGIEILPTHQTLNRKPVHSPNLIQFSYPRNKNVRKSTLPADH
ncbi:MAG: hypothetical protein ACK5MA_08245, partial [Parachlamydiaceae bacterium]